MIRVAVAGVLGNMGTLARETFSQTADVQYAGGFARSANGDIHAFDSLDALFEAATPDVLLDFTPRPVTQDVVRGAAARGVAVVVGSSEWDAGERAALQKESGSFNAPVLFVPNFAVGAVLMMQFAERAATFFPTAEIVELHRAEKRDKPSGTARATAERVRRVRGEDVPIHSVRLRGLLAHQEVLFGNTGELLTIRHDSLSRASFAQGMLLAVRNVRRLSGVVEGLEAVLDLG